MFCVLSFLKLLRFALFVEPCFLSVRFVLFDESPLGLRQGLLSLAPVAAIFFVYHLSFLEQKGHHFAAAFGSVCGQFGFNLFHVLQIEMVFVHVESCDLSVVFYCLEKLGASFHQLVLFD